MKKSRLIVDGVPPAESLQGSGAHHMAIDETLLRTAAETGESTLRFYSWRPATLSLGYFQKSADRVLHPASLDCDMVRRASGGGAILHDRELTYCFATPAKTRFRDRQEFYLAFHETFVELLSECGVHAYLQSSESGCSEQAFLCFQRRSPGDVILGDHKVVGSAQRRWKNALVQHGSVLLARSPYAPELLGLEDLASFNLDASAIIRLWLQKLALRLKTKFVPGGLADNEMAAAMKLADQKFSERSWSHRR